MADLPLTERSTNSLSSCARCSEIEALLIEAEDNLAEQARQLAGYERTLRSQLSREMKLRQQLEQQAETDPTSEQVKSVLHAWTVLHPRAIVHPTSERVRLVKKALKMGFTVEQLKLAVSGIIRYPNVGPQGRVRTGGKKFDDVSIALKDEVHIERFMRYATEGQEQRPAPVRAVPAGDPVERLLERLEGVKPGGLNEWTARCPAHEDRHSSLSVGVGRDGRVLAKCHTGCSHEQIAGAVGMPVGEWFAVEQGPVKVPPTPEVLPTDADLERWQAALASHGLLLDAMEAKRGWSLRTLEELGVGYDGRRLTMPVRAADGVLVNVLRYGQTLKPKMVAARNRPRDLFPAVEVVEGEEVWLVEGEPDAITAHEMGLPAVGVPGAGTWKPGWADRFAFRKVRVLMDCDDAGRKASGRIAAALAGVAAEVRVVDLDPARENGWDLSDFWIQGGSAAGLRLLAHESSSVQRLAS